MLLIILLLLCRWLQQSPKRKEFGYAITNLIIECYERWNEVIRIYKRI